VTSAVGQAAAAALTDGPRAIVGNRAGAVSEIILAPITAAPVPLARTGATLPLGGSTPALAPASTLEPAPVGDALTAGPMVVVAAAHERSPGTSSLLLPTAVDPALGAAISSVSVADALDSRPAADQQPAPRPGTPAAPSAPPAPIGGLGGNATGAAPAGAAFVLLFSIIGLLSLGAPGAMRRLTLASERWRPALYVLVPERPG
jgi:hypothetical protein